ncbi:MAG: hypothetical protein JRJ19_14795, partial [Deltaproteobacteria bacterium]|nr:hypothetical protein [Deltaproteobacteria bacterium]
SITGSACGDGVHSASNLGDPIVTLNAEVEGQLPENISAAHLRASILWETLPDTLLECMHKAQNADEVFACTNTNEFRPAQSTRSVAIEPTFPASFEVPMYTLPGPEVLSGDPTALLGYGILVVYEDGNENNELDLVSFPEKVSADTILASGIPTGVEKAIYVVYREGALSPLWKMFSIFGCGEPDQGFSVVDLVADANGVSCLVHPAQEAKISVLFEDSEGMRQLICEPYLDNDNYPPTDDPLPTDQEIYCHYSDSLEYLKDLESYCRVSQVYELAGCDNNFGCEVPDWDLRASPPDWWPCTGESDNGYTIEDAAAELTTNADELFSISFISGEKTFPMNEIEIWVFTAPNEALVFTRPKVIRLVDNDNDSLFSAGDKLELFEAPDTDKFNETHATTQFKLNLEHSINLSIIENLAELVWTP